MKILAVDTALGACSAALLDGDKILAHSFEAMDRGHAERLAPMVDETMKQAGMAVAALERLAVTIGPGTFTGQRVGIAFMRGLRLALHIPLIGVTTLETIALQASVETKSQKVAVIHDARREEAYLLLRDGDKVTLQPEVLPFTDAVEKIRAFGSCALAGTGAPLAVEALGSAYTLSDVRQPYAYWVAHLAHSLPVPEVVPGPLYLRAPDAKLPGGKALV